MSDVTEAVKKYWPWVAGGVVGLLLISYMRGSSSGTGTVTVGGLSAAESAQYGLQAAQIEANRDVAMAKTMGETNVAFLAAQGAAAQGVATGVNQIISALNAPTISAINAGAAENVATVQGAVAAQAASFETQSKTISAMAAGSLAMAQAQAAASSAIAAGAVASANSVANQQNGFRLAQGETTNTAGILKELAPYVTYAAMALA